MMFCLQKKYIVLAPLLAVVSTGMTQPDPSSLAHTDMVYQDMIRAEEVLDNKTDVHVRLDSYIPGHIETVWNSITDLNEIELELDEISMPLHGFNEYSEVDVAEMLLHDAMAACEQGKLNLLPFDQLLSTGFKLDGYVGNGLQPCGVGHSVWADIITFDNTLYLDKSCPYGSLA